MINGIKKVAVITGGAVGIGRACAEVLAESGYRVAVLYRSSADQANSLVDKLNKGAELNAVSIQVDVTNVESVKSAFDKVKCVFGRVDVLVNNAGVAMNKLLIDMSDAEIDNIIDTDFKGVVYCSRAVQPLLLESGGGAIINISSVWGVVGAAMETVYSGAKAAVIGFTMALSKELSYSGIRVNAVSPAVIDTDMNKVYSADEIAELIGNIPLGRMGSAREVAECVKFLALNEYITGANIEINGGFKE